MLTGSCLCGAVKYEVGGEINGFVHCHCHTCRKAHGTVFGSSALVSSETFKLVSGEDMLTRYASSPGKERCFCRRCGSHVFAHITSRPDTIILRIGTLDTDPGIRPEGHIWVSHKASWYEICDQLPQYDEAIPGKVR